jgi:hypothetical protein
MDLMGRDLLAQKARWAAFTNLSEATAIACDILNFDIASPVQHCHIER